MRKDCENARELLKEAYRLLLLYRYTLADFEYSDEEYNRDWEAFSRSYFAFFGVQMER